MVFHCKFAQDGLPRIINGDLAGKAADHWNLYKQDTKLLKDIGVDFYRFSVEWSKIEVRQL